MRKMNKLKAGVVTMAMTIAVSSMSAPCVFAAEDITSVNTSTDASSTSSDDTTTSSDSTDSTDNQSTTSDDSTVSTDDQVTASDDSTVSTDDQVTASDDSTVSTDDQTATSNDSTDSTDATDDQTTASNDSTDNQTDSSDNTQITPNDVSNIVIDASNDSALFASLLSSSDVAVASDVNDGISLLSDDVPVVNEMSGYLTDSSRNCHDAYNGEIVSVVDDNGNVSQFIKINLENGYFAKANPSDAYSMRDGDDYTNWCSNLPAGLRFTKFTNNIGASFGRFELKGTVTSTSTSDVTIIVPKNFLSASKDYVVPENGLALTFKLVVTNVDPVTGEVHVFPTLDKVEPVHESSSKGSGHHSTPKVELTDYEKFCNEVAEKVLSAQENGNVVIKTDKWISFNEKVTDALQTRSDVSLTLDFVYEGASYETTIASGEVRQITTAAAPALATEDGTIVDDQTPLAPLPTLNEDGNNYFGFMYLGSVYGLDNLN